MLSILVSLCLTLGLITPALAQDGRDPGFIDPQTGISLPTYLGVLKKAGARKYSQPGLGMGYRYENQPFLIRADIFIYDLGKKDLGTGLSSPQVRPQFEQAKKDIHYYEKLGYYRGVKKESEGEIVLASPSQKIAALSAVFTFSQTPKSPGAFQGVSVSHLLLTAYKGCFIKIRFTYPQEQEQGKKVWEKFLAEFAKTLK